MQLTESSIFINLKALRRRLYTAQFMMTKADRIIYGTPLMESCGRAHVEHLLSSVNSYLGLCKNLNGFSAAVSILKCLSEKWREYVTFNRRRVCLQALPDYSYRNRIIYQFNLK